MLNLLQIAKSVGKYIVLIIIRDFKITQYKNTHEQVAATWKCR